MSVAVDITQYFVVYINVFCKCNANGSNSKIQKFTIFCIKNIPTSNCRLLPHFLNANSMFYTIHPVFGKLENKIFKPEKCLKHF